MSKRPKQPTLASQMIEAGRFGRIRVRTVDDDTTAEQADLDERERLRKDRIGELPEGFSLLEKIRGGSIYFRRGDEVLVFDYEFSGAPNLTILVMSHRPMHWSNVHSLQFRPATPDEQQSTKECLVKWLSGRRIRFALDGKIHSGRRPRRAKQQ